MLCIVYKSYLSGSGHLLVFCPHEGDVLLMLGCSTDLDNSDRSVCRSVDGEREKSINSVFYYCAVYNRSCTNPRTKFSRPPFMSHFTIFHYNPPPFYVIYFHLMKIRLWRAVAYLETHLFASNFQICLCTLIGLCGCRLQLVLSLYLRPQHSSQHTISAFEWQLAFAELCIAFRSESKIN